MHAWGIHLQVQISQNRSWKQAGLPDYQKRIYRYTQNSVGWRKKGKKRRRVVRTRPAPRVGGGTEAEVRYPHEGNCLGQKRGIWGCWRVKQLLFLFLIEVFPNERVSHDGVSQAHINLPVPFQKTKTHDWWFCEIKQWCYVNMLTVLEDSVVRARSCLWILGQRERAGCSQHQWAVCPRKKLHQPFLVDPASCPSNRAAWLGPWEKLLVQTSREEVVQWQSWGELGSDACWGELRGKKPYFILLIQFPAGRSG